MALLSLEDYMKGRGLEAPPSDTSNEPQVAADTPEQSTETQQPSFNYKTYTNLVEASGQRGKGYHDPSRSSAFGDYGLTDTAFAAIKKADPYFATKRLDQLTSEEQDKAFDVYRSVQEKELKSKGIEVNDSNLSRAWFLGTEGLRERLSSGNYLDSTLKANAPKGTDINTPEGRAIAIKAVTEIDESRKHGMTIPEYRKALASGEVKSKFSQTVSKLNQPVSFNNFDLVDADTYRLKTGEYVRLPGINAREVANFNPETGEFKQGQYGGTLQRQIVEHLIKDKGFNIPTYDKNNKDPHGRFIGDLKNKDGELLSNYLLQYGLVNNDKSISKQQDLASVFGDLDRAQRSTEESSRRLTLAREGQYQYKDSGDYIFDTLNYTLGQEKPEPKPYADNAKTYGAYPDRFVGPGVIRPGEDKTGHATSNWSTGLDYGWNDFKRSIRYDSLGIVSDIFGSKTGADIAAKGAKYYNQIEAELPILRNAEAFDPKTGEWKLDTFNKITDYAVATLAQSAPDLPLAIISTALMVPTAGLSLLPSVARNAGQIWHEQEEGKKNPWWALVGGSIVTGLDTLGARGVAKHLGAPAMIEAGIEKLVKQGYTREAAEKAVIAESKKVLNQTMDVVKAASMGGVEESWTEGAQQLTQYFSRNQKFEIDDPIALKNEILNAAVGGFTGGFAISGAGRTYTMLTHNPTVSATPKDIQFREENFVSKGLNVPSVDSVIKEASVDTSDYIPADQLKGIEENKRRTAGLVSTVKNWWQDKGILSLWGKYGQVIDGDDAYKGKFSAALSTILGSTNAINGGDFFANKEIVSAIIQRPLGSFGNIIKSFNLDNQKISDIMYRSDVINYIDSLIDSKLGRLDPSLKQASEAVKTPKYLEKDMLPYRAAIDSFAGRINQMIQERNRLLNGNLKTKEFLSNRSLNKKVVASNREQFTQDLKKLLNLSDKDASLMVHNLLSKEDEAVTQKSISGPSFDPRLIRDQILATDKNGVMKRYFNNNLFDNLTHFSHGSGRAYSMQTFIGKDMEKVNNLLNAAVKAGEISVERAAFKAKEIQDWLDIEVGEYHRIDNAFYNGALNTVSFLAALSKLPLAAISSLPEAAQVMRGLNTPQALKAYKGLLSSFSSEFYAVIKEIGTMNKYQELQSRNELQKYGFATGEENIANRHDIQAGVFQNLTNGFFKFTMLQGITNATRYARQSVASDAINSWIGIVSVPLMMGEKLNQQQQDAYEHLIRIGIDPHEFIVSDADRIENIQQRLAETVDEEAKKEFKTKLRKAKQREERLTLAYERGIHNFVNEAVVHPNSLNRPKFYNDPYLKLFTLFQGYISAFTANILPRLYGDLGKKGSADQKNAVATIATIIALSMLALAIKDMIKYGEHPPKWLEGDEKKLAQRIIGATGLTGTGERVINFVNPLVDQKSENSAAWLFNVLKGESAPVSYITEMGSAMEATFNPEGKKAIKKVMKVTPMTGSINQLGDYMQEKFGGN